MIVRPQPEKVAAITALLMPHIADKERLIGALCSCCDLDDNGSTAMALAELNRAGKIIVADLIRHLASIKEPGVRPIEMAAEHLLLALAQLAPSCDIFIEALSHCQSLGSQGFMYMAVSDAAREYAANFPDNALAFIDLLIPRANEDMFLVALKAALFGRCQADMPNGLDSVIMLAHIMRPGSNRLVSKSCAPSTTPEHLFFLLMPSNALKTYMETRVRMSMAPWSTASPAFSHR